MRKLLFAALLAIVPAASHAAVTIDFTGTTFAPTAAGDVGGSYVRTVGGGADTYAIDPARSVAGRIVIDTAALGANGAAAPSVYYDGAGGSFLTFSFTSTGAQPVQRSGVLTSQSIDSDSGLTFDLFDEDSTYAYSFGLYSLNAIPTASYGGVLLPDFAKADGLFFTVTSRVGGNDAYVETVSQGAVAALTVTDGATAAVPEPAGWAMMMVGIGLAGAAMRRRRTAAGLVFAA